MTHKRTLSRVLAVPNFDRSFTFDFCLVCRLLIGRYWMFL
jgi:hypothetical protein